MSVPTLDDAVRGRLTKRFGPEIAPWLDELPDVLKVLGEHWHIEWGPLIPRGSMSVVIRCVADERPAVLKISPDRPRLATEAAALAAWTTVHTPSVLAVDESIGALLIEAIEPGTPMVESLVHPDVGTTAELLNSFRVEGAADLSYPPLAHRVERLFASGASPYERRPELLDLIPRELYERGRELAMGLARSVAPAGLLHGDLTPSNILDGGARGLVAIDPAPCLGDDAAFDAVDLVLWQADDVDTIAARAAQLAPAIDVDGDRLYGWCSAFAAMTALEIAESRDAPPDRVHTYLELAAQVPGA